MVTHAVAAMAELNIADAIASGSHSADEIASDLGLNPGTLARLLRYLSSIGLLEGQANSEYSLTPMGEMLRTDVPGSFNSMAQIFGSDYGAAAAANLAHSIRTGEPAFDAAHGVGIFDYIQPREKDRQLFYSAFTGLSTAQAPVIAAAYDFQAFDSIVDVGGGYGYLLLEILKLHDHPTGILYDLEQVIKDAEPLIADEGLADRCSIVAGDFFESVPSGASAYVMKLILHDWNDDQAATILERCRSAMAPGGKVVVIDMVVPEGPDYGLTLNADLNMMVLTEGRERTEEDFNSLGSASGLRVASITPTATSLSVIEMVEA